MKRRQFLQQASTAAGIGILVCCLELLCCQPKDISPNEKLGIAVIGCNGMVKYDETFSGRWGGVYCRDV